MQIGVTETRRRDVHEHLPGAWFRNVDVAKLRFVLPADELNCAH
jgi:hypothetical protein